MKQVDKVILALLLCGFPTASTAAPKEQKAADVVERSYLIKGMFCGACALGVKKALRSAGLEDKQILEVDPTSPDPGKRVGHAKVRFTKKQYKGIETDCKIAGEIESQNPIFSVYWDPKQPSPCKKSN